MKKITLGILLLATTTLGANNSIDLNATTKHYTIKSTNDKKVSKELSKHYKGSKQYIFNKFMLDYTDYKYATGDKCSNYKYLKYNSKMNWKQYIKYLVNYK